MGRTAVVIPFYNEAHRFDVEAYRRFVDAQDGRIRLILVDDGSTDATRQCLEDFASRADGHAEVVTQDVNQGKAEAVRQGVLTVLQSEANDYDWIG